MIVILRIGWGAAFRCVITDNQLEMVVGAIELGCLLFMSTHAHNIHVANGRNE